MNKIIVAIGGDKMKLNIRKAITSDAESIAKINVSSWQKTYKNIFPSEFLDSLSDEINFKNTIMRMQENIKKDNNYLVAEFNNEVVGFCKIGKSTKENYENYGEIIALYVKNEEAKKGIGKQLFIAANNLLKETYKNNILSCIKENLSNNFYKKMGCVLLGECDFNLKGVIYKENLYVCP